MAFPPTFCKLGSNLNDMLTKKYNFKNQTIFRQNVNSDTTFESRLGYVGDKSNRVDGGFKVTHKQPNSFFAESEVDVNTSGQISAKLTSKKIGDGLTLTVEGCEKPSGCAKAEYRGESFTAGVGVGSCGASNSTMLCACGTFGADNIVFGLGGKYNVSSKEVGSLDAGFEFRKNNFTLTAKSQEKGEKLNIGYHYTTPSKQQIGAMMEWPLASTLEQKVFTLSAEQQINQQSSISMKASSNGTVTGFGETKLSNPGVKVSASAQWDAIKRTACPDLFGVQLTFGDN